MTTQYIESNLNNHFSRYLSGGQLQFRANNADEFEFSIPLEAVASKLKAILDALKIKTTTKEQPYEYNSTFRIKINLKAMEKLQDCIKNDKFALKFNDVYHLKTMANTQSAESVFEENMHRIANALKMDAVKDDAISTAQHKQQVFFQDEFFNIPEAQLLDNLKLGYQPRDAVPSCHEIKDSYMTPKDSRYRKYSRHRVIAGPVKYYDSGQATEIGMVTACGINLMGSSPADLKNFTFENKRSGGNTLKKATYEYEVEKLARFITKSTKEAGYDNLVMPAFGVGVYAGKLKSDSKDKAMEITVKAFAQAAEENELNITWVVWNGASRQKDTQEEQQRLEGYCPGNQWINFQQGTVQGIALEKKSANQNVAMLNAGSDRTIGGYFICGPNPTTIEEQLAQGTDLLLMHTAYNEHLVSQFSVAYKNAKKLKESSSATQKSNTSSFKPSAPPPPSFFQDNKGQVEPSAPIEEAPSYDASNEDAGRKLLKDIRDAVGCNFFNGTLEAKFNTKSTQSSGFISNIEFSMNPERAASIMIKMFENLNISFVNIKNSVATTSGIPEGQGEWHNEFYRIKIALSGNQNVNYEAIKEAFAKVSISDKYELFKENIKSHTHDQTEEEYTFKLESAIDKLTKEINSSWPYPNKKRKITKRDALMQFHMDLINGSSNPETQASALMGQFREGSSMHGYHADALSYTLAVNGGEDRSNQNLGERLQYAMSKIQSRADYGDIIKGSISSRTKDLLQSFENNTNEGTHRIGS